MINEVYVFLSAMGSGAIAGFIYDIFRLKRKVMKTKTFITGLEDVVFWVITALLVFVTAYFSNEGEIRLYFLFGACVGVLIYYWLFSRWVIQILTFLIKIVIWPFAFVIKALKTPAKWLAAVVVLGAERAEQQLIKTRKKLKRRCQSIQHIIRKV
ncbi:MAG: spore cortex biosynthesis protein YabQ [Clostridiaceae bacterium]|jgi:spore cortex biosynthesis protein YabQ|nr:spore cortex biosynthesis protein YabQ [Clostridiaceae bacterium]